ncbi:MAG: helix-turn-helix domain-containing protein [Pseudomonas sp.]
MDTLLSGNLLYLWDQRTFFLGVLPEPRQVSQAAPMLAVSLDHPMRVQAENCGRAIVCHSVLFRSGQQVRTDSGNGVVALCFLDPFGQDYANLAAAMTEVYDGMCVRLEEEPLFQSAFADVFRKPPAPDALYLMLEQLFHPDKTPPVLVDPRVVKVVQRIKSSVADNLSLTELASEINLSVPRLVELFKGHLGVPIRRYRQWHRLYVTAVGVSRGDSLTEAAIAAGFTDSSHFSNTFRTMLGMKPSTILSNRHRVHIFAPALERPKALLVAR